MFDDSLGELLGHARIIVRLFGESPKILKGNFPLGESMANLFFKLETSVIGSNKNHLPILLIYYIDRVTGNHPLDVFNGGIQDISHRLPTVESIVGRQQNVGVTH